MGNALVVYAQSPQPAKQPSTGMEEARQATTLVIFADRRMGDPEWTSLFAALRREVPEAVPESPDIPGIPQMVRGGKMDRNLRVETPISVFLHGDCTIHPFVRRTVFGGTLDWVRRVDGRIEPFAHVDCTRIGQVLGAQAMGLDQDHRNSMMAGAIARVILHEWIHIAAQTRGHTRFGLSKAQFGVDDLTADSRQTAAIAEPMVESKTNRATRISAARSSCSQ